MSAIIRRSASRTSSSIYQPLTGYINNVTCLARNCTQFSRMNGKCEKCQAEVQSVQPMTRLICALLPCILILTAACQPAGPVISGQLESPPPKADLSEAETVTPLPAETAPVAEPSPTPTNEPEAPVCSPFSDWDQAALREHISNPFSPPPFGSDDPHQGIDLSEYDPANGYAVPGKPVQAVLAGTVAGVWADRFPYGNALLVETRREDLPEEIRAIVPSTLPALEFYPTLSCPPAEDEPPDGPFSVYTLYAHLQEVPVKQVGDAVTCGEQVGHIGQSGNALNPHLHIEIRYGPPGAKIASMAHYDNSATGEEMAAYCAWRVGGQFALLNPLDVLALLP